MLSIYPVSIKYLFPIYVSEKYKQSLSDFLLPFSLELRWCSYVSSIVSSVFFSRIKFSSSANVKILTIIHYHIRELIFLKALYTCVEGIVSFLSFTVSKLSLPIGKGQKFLIIKLQEVWNRRWTWSRCDGVFLKWPLT